MVVLDPQQTKLERGREMLRAATERKLRALGLTMARTELRCRNLDCRRVLLHYDPPIGRVTVPCKRCGTWTEFSTIQ